MAGVTENGFEKKTESQVVSALNEKARTEFGNVYLGENDFLGQLFRSVAREVAEIWELGENIYFQQFLSTASGVNVDRLAGSIERLRNVRSIVTLTFTGTAGATITRGFLVESDLGVRFTTDVLATIGTDGTVPVLARAVLSGESGNVNENTITTIVNATVGVTAVNNPDPAHSGSTEESDDQFINRVLTLQDPSISSSIIDLAASLYEINDVIEVSSLENTTGGTDANGLPPRSFELLVNGGADQDIIDRIARYRPAGIRAFGAITGTSTVGDITSAAAFTRPTQVSIAVRISLTASSSLSATDMERITLIVRTNIIKYIGGSIGGVQFSGLAQGGNVLYWKVSASVFEQSEPLDEITNSQVTMAVSGNTLSNSDISIADRQKAITSETLITVIFA